ncbi:MAG: cyclic nucleotide-binding and patatin-like phospholipase domain-containing protein [Betaproteobacteria bacterium]|jgi:predicted acylesterase/phospholipase RssA/CRP-like cAMP-binding protein
MNAPTALGDEDAAPQPLDALLAALGLQDASSSALLLELRAMLQHRVVQPGEVLLRQGDSGDDLFLVLRGRIGIRVEHADGTFTDVEEIRRGGVVGEMALLTGQPRTATVFAVEASDLGRLTRMQFEHLATRHPQAMQAFMRRALPRLRQTQVVRLLTELFGHLDDAVLREIEGRLEWVHLPSGDLLFREGDPGEDIYIVVNGRLRVTTPDGNGQERVLEEVGRGGAVGEVALLTGEPRSASIRAIRDTHLLRLSRAAFDELLDRHPRAMMQIVRGAAWRLRHAAQHIVRESRPRTFALVPATPDVPLDAFGRRLADILRAFGRTALLGSADVDGMLNSPGIAQSQESSVVHEALTAWLGGQEREHDALLLQADPQWSAWSGRCVTEADRILVVANASGEIDPGEVERSVNAKRQDGRIELVLLHPDTASRPSRTLAWLTARTVTAHHHVRLGNDADMRRLARRVSGRAVGLVLGGGGARGFAHIGTLRALAEAGISVDVVGGTSIGALIAAAVAADMSPEDMERIAATFASPRQLLDRTLPVAALMTGGKVTDLYRRMFGDIAIEDLWTPYFGISSGLSRATAIVHRRGPVWRAVRASTALPAIFPPLLGDDDEVHVDGGVMNNMPLDVMRGLCEGGTVIGVNPMPTHDRLRSYHFGPSLSGWQALMGRLRLFGSRVRAPSILGTVMRATEINSANRMRQASFRQLADLLIEPPVGDFPILAFDRYAPIIDIGYREAKARITAWQAAGNAVGADPP